MREMLIDTNIQSLFRLIKNNEQSTRKFDLGVYADNFFDEEGEVCGTVCCLVGNDLLTRKI